MQNLLFTSIYGVTELTKLIKDKLEQDTALSNVWVRGEIGTYRRHSSGHLYFSLRDKNSLMKCVMFRRSAQQLSFEPTSGLGVLAFGRVGLYERDGQYQLYVTQLEPDGLGAQYLALEQSKRNLEQDGLLAPERKRPLPKFPRTVAVITSPVGAALHDIVAVARRRYSGVEIVLLPVLVQGEHAPKQIIGALQQVNATKDIDVVIVARGGGSREDLWVFNNEQVARQMAASNIPVVCAVGHETDLTLADFVSDVRASTPSAAAELVFPDRYQMEKDLLHASQRLDDVFTRYSAQRHNVLQQLLQSTVWRQPHTIFAPWLQQFKEHKTNFASAVARLSLEKQQTIIRYSQILMALDPMAVLSRGFALAEDLSDGHVIRNASSLRPGQKFQLRFVDDCIVVEVVEIMKGGYDHEPD